MTSAPSIAQTGEGGPPAGSFPDHIAIIMDGNGRWAGKRAMSRLKGHEQGAKAVREIMIKKRNPNSNRKSKEGKNKGIRVNLQITITKIRDQRRMAKTTLIHRKKEITEIKTGTKIEEIDRIITKEIREIKNRQY